jgi:hypothetical protein
VHGFLAAHEDMPFLECELPDTRQLTRLNEEHYRGLLQQLQSYADIALAERSHVWYGSTLTDLSLSVEQMLRSRLQALAEGARKARECGTELATQLGLVAVESVGDADRLLRLIEILERDHQVHQAWLEPEGLPRARAAAQHANEVIRGIVSLERSLLEHYDVQFLEENAATLRAPINTLLEQDDLRLHSALDDVVLHHRAELLAEVDAIASRIQRIEADAHALAVLLQLDAPTSLDDARRLATIGSDLDVKVQPVDSWFEPDQSKIDDVLALARHHSSRLAVQGQLLNGHIKTDAIGAITPELRDRFRGYGVFRWLQPSFYRDRSTVRSVFADGTLPDPEDLWPLLDAAVEYSTAKAWFAEH